MEWLIGGGLVGLVLLFMKGSSKADSAAVQIGVPIAAQYANMGLPLATAVDKTVALLARLNPDQIKQLSLQPSINIDRIADLALQNSIAVALKQGTPISTIGLSQQVIADLVSKGWTLGGLWGSGSLYPPGVKPPLIK